MCLRLSVSLSVCPSYAFRLLKSEAQSFRHQIFDEVTFALNSSESRAQVLWPRHCLQDSEGAQLHSDLLIPPNATIIQKGKNSDVDSYSAFWDNSKLKSTELESVLREAGVTAVYVCGIATDVCVKATAIDAIELGFQVFLVKEACRGVEEKAIEKALEEIRGLGGKIVSLEEVV